MNENDNDSVDSLRLSQRVVLQVSVLVVALCGIVYELIIASISSYLLGDSVYQFSLTIGLFMFAMGMGSLATRNFRGNLIEWFVITEVLIAIVGGASSVVLFCVFPWTVFYQPVMYTLILLIGILVGLEIPLLIRVLSESGGFRKSVAHVLALDYFGALVGSVAFPLLLLPFLGLFRASFCIGLLNGLIALLNIVVFSEMIRRPKLWIATTACSLIALTVGMLYASSIMKFAEGQLFTDQIVFSRQTPYQRIVLTKHEFTDEHRLYLDGHLQFAQRDEYRYHESLVHPVMSLAGNRQRVLILGGGDGLVAREVLKYDDVEHIDLVDIDPEITRLCSTFPVIKELNQGSLDSSRLTIHHVDAFSFLRESKQIFDRIIIDLPDPHNEALSKLYSVEFYKLVRRRLSPEGYFATQSSSPWVTRGVFWSIAATIEAADMKTHSYHITVPSFSIWGFHIAAATGEVPSDFELPADSRFLTEEVLQRASVFGKDESRVDGVVNSIFEPKLYLLYHHEVTN